MRVNCEKEDIFIHRRCRLKDNHGDFLSAPRCYVQGELLPQPPPVLFLGFHGVEKWKLDDVGPDGRTGAPAQTAG